MAFDRFHTFISYIENLIIFMFSCGGEMLPMILVWSLLAYYFDWNSLETRFCVMVNWFMNIPIKFPYWLPMVDCVSMYVMN